MRAKAKSSANKKVIISMCLMIWFSGATYILGWSSLFTVKQILVLGAPTKVDSSIIEQMSHISLGERMARLEPRVASSLLQNFSWLDHANISRNWIHGTVVIHVWPRMPIATYGDRLVDAQGSFFNLPNFVPGSLPYLVAKNDDAVRFAISLLNQLPTTIKSQLLGLNVSSLNSATLFLRIPSLAQGKILKVIWGDGSNMELKVKVYQALIALPENANISQMDLSAPHAPIVK